MSETLQGMSLATGFGERVNDLILPDLQRASKVIQDVFGERVRALVVGGSLARGEGCAYHHGGRLVPASNIDLFLLTREEPSRSDLDRARHEILESSIVESVRLTPLVETGLDKLPALPLYVDLGAGFEVLTGDASRIRDLDVYDPSRLDRLSAEAHLRENLVLLLEAFPGTRSSFRSFYRSAKVIFRAIDAFLIRQEAYASSYVEKAERFRARVPDASLHEWIDTALEIKLHARVPEKLEASTFWQVALRLYLDSLLGLFSPPGSHRGERLDNLLGSFDVLSSNFWKLCRERFFKFLGANRARNAERFLLALAIDRDVEASSVDLERIARLTGIRLATGPEPSWDDYRAAGIDAWHGSHRRG